ncbi:hypothetical protein AAG906_005572 [Vitis piasezkii]
MSDALHPPKCCLSDATNPPSPCLFPQGFPHGCKVFTHEALDGFSVRRVKFSLACMVWKFGMYNCVIAVSWLCLNIEKKKYFFSLKFLHGIKTESELFNLFMTKYGKATKDSSTLEVTSTQEAPIPSNNGGSDGAVFLITGCKLNGRTIFNGENFILNETTQEIWEATRETHFNTEDIVEAFEKEGILHDLCQGSALASRGPLHLSSDNRPRKRRPWCNHCRKPSHNKDTYWKIHGKLAYWKPSRPQNDREIREHHVTIEYNPTPSNSGLFSKEQLKLLQKMFNQSQQGLNSSNSISGFGSLTQKGLGSSPPFHLKCLVAQPLFTFPNIIEGENGIQEDQFWEIETMTKPQTLESVIVHNSNPISLAPNLPLQTTEFVDIELSALYTIHMGSEVILEECGFPLQFAGSSGTYIKRNLDPLECDSSCLLQFGMVVICEHRETLITTSVSNDSCRDKSGKIIEIVGTDVSVSAAAPVP